MEEDILDSIIKNLIVIENKLEKIKIEQSEGKSECSKTKIEIINRKLNCLILKLQQL